jgi:hypothetical protein
METNLSQVPVFKSATRILVKVDRNRIKECVIQLITMEEIMSKKKLDGYLVPVVELAKFYTVDATAMKRKLKRKGFKIDKAIVMYNGSERSLNVISAVDARAFVNEPGTDSKLLCSADLDTLLD